MLDVAAIAPVPSTFDVDVHDARIGGRGDGARRRVASSASMITSLKSNSEDTTSWRAGEVASAELHASYAPMCAAEVHVEEEPTDKLSCWASARARAHAHTPPAWTCEIGGNKRQENERDERFRGGHDLYRFMTSIDTRVRAIMTPTGIATALESVVASSAH